MKSVIRICGVTGLALGASACGTMYTLDVTAFSSPDESLDKTYVLLSRSPEIDIHSPQFSVYAGQVERALEPRGYTRKPGDDLASVSLAIYLSADISDPGKRYHTVTTGIYESPYSENSTAAVRGGGSGGGGGQRPQTPPPVPAQPPEVLAGYKESGFATTVYTKYLNLVAVDLQRYLADIAEKGKSDATPIQIWSVDVYTTGKPSELREAVPVMIAAAQPFMTGRTDDVVRVKIGETDRRVRAIQGNE